MQNVALVHDTDISPTSLTCTGAAQTRPPEAGAGDGPDAVLPQAAIKPPQRTTSPPIPRRCVTLPILTPSKRHVWTAQPYDSVTG